MAVQIAMDAGRGNVIGGARGAASVPPPRQGVQVRDFRLCQPGRAAGEEARGQRHQRLGQLQGLSS